MPKQMPKKGLPDCSGLLFYVCDCVECVIKVSLCGRERARAAAERRRRRRRRQNGALASTTTHRDIVLQRLDVVALLQDVDRLPEAADAREDELVGGRDVGRLLYLFCWFVVCVDRNCRRERVEASRGALVPQQAHYLYHEADCGASLQLAEPSHASQNNTQHNSRP